MNTYSSVTRTNAVSAEADTVSPSAVRAHSRERHPGPARLPLCASPSYRRVRLRAAIRMFPGRAAFPIRCRFDNMLLSAARAVG